MEVKQIIAAGPLFAIIIAALIGIAVELTKFIADAPLLNGGIVLFSFWMVAGMFYLAMDRS